MSSTIVPSDGRRNGTPALTARRRQRPPTVFADPRHTRRHDPPATADQIKDPPGTRAAWTLTTAARAAARPERIPGLRVGGRQGGTQPHLEQLAAVLGESIAYFYGGPSAHREPGEWSPQPAPPDQRDIAELLRGRPSRMRRDRSNWR